MVCFEYGGALGSGIRGGGRGFENGSVAVGSHCAGDFVGEIEMDILK